MKRWIDSSLRPVRANDFVFSITEEGFLVIIDFKPVVLYVALIYSKELKKKRNKIRAIGFVVGKKKYVCQLDRSFCYKYKWKY